MKSILKNGSHFVHISGCKIGMSKKSKCPFLQIKFENDYGVIYHKFYYSGNTRIVLNIFLSVININENNALDLQSLLNKSLHINVINTEYYDNFGKKRIFYEVNRFFKNNKRFSFKNSEYEHTSIDEFADIFGTDVNEIAAGMRKDPSEVTESDIREAMGY